MVLSKVISTRLVVNRDKTVNMELGTGCDSVLPTGPVMTTQILCVFVIILLEHDRVDYPMFCLSLSTWNDLGNLPDNQKYW